MAQVAEWWRNETFIPLDWAPPPTPTPPPGRRWVRRVTASVMVVLVLASAGLGWLAWSEHGVAQRDAALVRRQATQLRVLQDQVAADRRTITATSSVAGELQACIDATGKASADLFGFLTGSDQKAESVCNTAEADYQQVLSSSAGSGH